MPRGIPNKKKLAKKAVRSYIKKAQTLKEEFIVPEITVTNKQRIMEMMNSRHIIYQDMDGHFAVGRDQMIDSAGMIDLCAVGVQAMNVRRSGQLGSYIALYY